MVALDEDQGVGGQDLLGEHLQAVALQAEPQETVVGEHLVPKEHLWQPPGYKRDNRLKIPTLVSSPIDGNIK